MEVWDKTADVIKDPVLVGVVVDGQYEWNVKHYFILARWGEVLETFSTILKQAIGVRREKLIGEATSIVKQAECISDAELMNHSGVSW